MINAIIKFFLENKLVTYLLLLLFTGWGIVHAPFDWNIDFLPSDPVSVDAIPDIGENQQIVFTKWQGRSPQDVEDQITYPLTSALLGLPGVKSIRSTSMFGFSSIYVIFADDIDFYWSRSRILEKLNALPGNTLPEGVQPTLGPDATALGQIFWYTLEGRDKEGNPTGGWDLQELRSIQDFYVRYGLSSAQGVSEVASIGGYVKEYQIDVDPSKMKSLDLSLTQVMAAVSNSNIDIGAQTMEINKAEYFVRGLGYVKNVHDIEASIVVTRNNIPIRIKDVARVTLGPATRRGVLDKSGAEAVGGVVVARYGSNPLEVINNVKEKIKEIQTGLPSKTLGNGTLSQVTLVPFYDRTQLIKETIGTLEEALTLEIIITVIVVILLLLNLKSSVLVSATLPIAVLMCFIAMKYFGVDANIVALSGIAIAIGTMVDMGIVLTENIVARLDNSPEGESTMQSVYQATTEVGSAVVTAVATTVISFLPVFAMQASEGKLFRPLAYTKTFALIAAVIVALCFIPPLMHTLFSWKKGKKISGVFFQTVLFGISIWVTYYFDYPLLWILIVITGAGLLRSLFEYFFSGYESYSSLVVNIIYASVIGFALAYIWMPMGVNNSVVTNFIFVALIVASLLLFFWLVIRFYDYILGFLLKFKILFLLVVGSFIYFGFHIFKNTGQEFMPSLDEGSFLLMPTSMPHSGIQENINNLKLLDMAVTAIPEVESVVGKAGRVESALDPAPLSMYENVIIYNSEYKTDENGRKIRYKINPQGEYQYDEDGALIPDKNGQYFRQWREEIKSPDDIWNEIVKVTKLPGVTSAPKLQPIETRLVMLQTGMRAPMGIKVRGSDLKEMEAFGLQIENYLKEVESVKDPAVFAERIVGKPYLLIDIDREKIARYGLTISEVQRQIQVAVGGMTMSQTVEGRERYSMRVRYPRELRDNPQAIKNIFIKSTSGQIPLGEMVNIRYEQGPQAVKSEDGFLVSYVLFDKEDGYAETDVVNEVITYLEQKINEESLIVPSGISYRFGGNFEQQVRANKRLSIVLPIALALIFLILYLQFRSTAIALMVFSGVFVAFAGGFIMIYLYGQSWFMDFNFLGINMRDFFQMKTINLSVAVWVGFLALFGIATDDGVLVATYLKDSFSKNNPQNIREIRDAVIEGGRRRVRPAMMTTATTLLALLPVLSSTGRGSDIMVPMAIPSFGGMALQVITMFTVPVLFALWKESDLRWKKFKN